MSPTTARVSREEAGVRRRLMNAAITLFARKGYAATTVREIVQGAEVTKPVLYYHFGNKAGIFLAVMQDGLKEFDATVAAVLAAAATARERVVRFLGDAFELVLRNVEVMRVIDAIYYGPPQGAPYFDFEVVHRKFIETLTGLVNDGICSGEFKRGDAEETAWALVGCFEVARGMSLCHPEARFDRAKLARLVDVVFEGVVADAGGRRGGRKGR
jgi:TetR/AcrR family transcriptional regulator